MKTLLSFLVLFLTIGITSYSQNLSLMDDSLELNTVYSGEAQIYSVSTSLYNSSSSDIVVNWELLDPDNVLIPEWSSSTGFCNDELCTLLAFTTASKFTIEADDSVVLKMQVSPSNYDASTVLVFELEDSANTADMLQLTFDISMQKDFTSIADVEKNSINLYPNPTSGLINFDSDLEKNVSHIEIYNVVGKLEKTMPFENTISVSDLQSGLYLIKLFDAKEEIFLTQTFVKN